MLAQMNFFNFLIGELIYIYDYKLIKYFIINPFLTENYPDRLTVVMNMYPICH